MRAPRSVTPAAMLVALAVSLASFTASAARPFAWPEGRRAAVSLAYDDALDSQLDIAIPALDRHGFKGSFYLPLANATIATRLEDWRSAARNGHELGNHTLFHQCSGSRSDRDWVVPERDLSATTAAQMRDQILLANTLLAAIDGATRRTLTLPCGESMASDGDYLPRVKDQFVGIKVASGGVAPDMAEFDPTAVGVAAPAGLSGQQLISMVDDAGRRGTMVNFTFHGIGGDYLTTSAQAHEELLAYLARHRDRYWVDTFLNLMTHVRKQRQIVAAPDATR